MTHGLIQGRVKTLASQHQLEEAITALKCLVIDNEFNKKVLVLSSNFYNNEKKQRTQTDYSENLYVRNNQISTSIISFADEIPDDLHIIKNRFKYELKTSTDIERIIDALVNCSTDYSGRDVIQLKQQWLQKQGELDRTGSDSDVSDDLSTAIYEFSNQVSFHIDSFDNNKLNQNSVLDYFWNNFLTDSEFAYINSNDKIKTITASIYSSSIIDKVGEERAYMLLWEEEMLAGKKEKSLEYINHVRIELGVSTSIVYEFTALSFLETLGASKVINDAIKGKVGSSFEKLKLYISRAAILEGQSTSLNDSLKYIFDQLISAIDKIYVNIDYNYILMDGASGQSMRRNMIKKCIEISIEICEFFKEYKFDNDRFLEKMILELDGGGKYDWFKMLTHNEIADKTTFPSWSMREKLLSLVNNEKKSNSFSDNLYNVLLNCKVPDNDSKAAKKYVIACEIAFLLYHDPRFQELQPFALKKQMNVRDVVLPSTTEPSNKEDDKVLERVLSQIQDHSLKEPVALEAPIEPILRPIQVIHNFFSKYYKRFILTSLIIIFVMILVLFNFLKSFY